MRTRDDIFTEVLVRNNLTTTDSFITDTILKAWYRDAHMWSTSYHKWPMTEGRIQTTFATATGPNSDEWFFEGYKQDSFRLMQIGGKALKKLTFADYQIFRETEPTGTGRVFSDFGKTVFINPYADVSGTVVAYGQYQPYIDVTDETGTTIFTDFNDEGNEGIVEKMQGHLKRRLHLPQEAELHDQRAVAKLDEVWKRILEEQGMYQTHQDRGGMFQRIDVVEGNYENELYKRNQFL